MVALSIALLATLSLPLPAAARGQDAGASWLELPAGPAARAWENVAADTVPATCPADWSAWLASVPAPDERTWEGWGRALDAARSGSPQAIAGLCLFARAQGRAGDAWAHFARLASEPAWLAALAPRLMPGVGLGAPLSPGGRPAPQPDGARLAPLVPPTSSSLPGGSLEWRSATARGLEVGSARFDASVTVESTGVQIDLVPLAGGPATVLSSLSPPDGFRIEYEYLDWDRLDGEGGQPRIGTDVAVVLREGDERHSHYGRTIEGQASLPLGPVAELPRQIVEGGLTLLVEPGEPQPEAIASLAGVLQGLFGVPVSAQAGAGDGPWTSTVVRVPAREPERSALLAYLVSRVEHQLLAPREARASGGEAELRLPPGGRIVCLGDTLTFEGAYVDALRAFLAATRPDEGCTVENAGLPGSTAASALERLELEVVRREPDVVIVQLGNDPALEDAPAGGSFAQDLERILDRLARECAAQVLVLGPLPVELGAAGRSGAEPPAGDASRFADRATSARTAAERAGVAYLDLGAALAPVREILRAQPPPAEPPGGLRADDGMGLAIAAAIVERLGPVPPLRLVLGAPAAGEARAVQTLVPARLPVAVSESAAAVARSLELEGRWNALELDARALSEGRWRLERGATLLVRFETDAAGAIVAREDHELAQSPWHEQAVELLSWVRRLGAAEVADVRSAWWAAGALDDEARRRAAFAGLAGELRLMRVKLEVLEREVRARAAERAGEVVLVRE